MLVQTAVLLFVAFKLIILELPGAEVGHLRLHDVFKDNTWLSGALFNPFEHGVDIVLESMTKPLELDFSSAGERRTAAKQVRISWPMHWRLRGRRKLLDGSGSLLESKPLAYS